MNVFIFRGSQLNFPFVGRARLIYYAVIRTAAQPGTLIGSAAVVVRTLALEAAAVDPGGTPKIDRDILCRTSTPYLFRTRQLLPRYSSGGPSSLTSPLSRLMMTVLRSGYLSPSSSVLSILCLSVPQHDMTSLTLMSGTSC